MMSKAKKLLLEEYSRLLDYKEYLLLRLKQDEGFPIEGYWKKRVEEVSAIIEQLKKHLEIDKPDYCERPEVESCEVCSLSSYGRDCMNILVRCNV